MVGWFDGQCLQKISKAMKPWNDHALKNAYYLKIKDNLKNEDNRKN